jgi:hypothetical protein
MTMPLDRRVFGWIAGLALCALLLAPAAQAQKKGKKKKGPGAVNITRTVNAPVPDATTPPPTVGVLNSTIDVGRQFRGKRIRDVDVTLQYTGVGPSPSSAAEISARLIAPNGAATTLVSSGLGPGNLVGPLTITDESLLTLDFGVADDATSLFAPYQGSARPDGQPLWRMDNGPVSGTWTLRVLDLGIADISVLNFWRLNVVAGNPYKTK